MKPLSFIVLLMLCLSGCRTPNMEKILDLPKNSMYYYMRWTDKIYRCPACNLRGVYVQSAGKKEHFTHFYAHYYQGAKHSWIVIEDKGETSTNLVIKRK